jgi:Uma2 family endonuclease
MSTSLPVASDLPFPPIAVGGGEPLLLGQWSLADLYHHLGDIPLDRIRLFPSPGTASEEDLKLLDGQGLWELIDGTLVHKAMGQYESDLGVIISYLIQRFLEEHDLGKTLGADCMVRLRTGIVLEPDVVFVRWDQFPPGPRSREAFLLITPNLVVEVLSPSNTAKEMARKRREYFAAGVERVWEIEPDLRSARDYRAAEEFDPVPPEGHLEGGSILPGFRLSLADVFARADRVGPQPG